MTEVTGLVFIAMNSLPGKKKKKKEAIPILSNMLVAKGE